MLPMQESVSIRRGQCRLASKGEPYSHGAATLSGDAHKACLFLSSAADLLYGTQPILYLAVGGLGQDVVRAGLAIGGQPVAQLCRILSVPPGAQRDGKSRLRSIAAQTADNGGRLVGRQPRPVPTVAETDRPCQCLLRAPADPYRYRG